MYARNREQTQYEAITMKEKAILFTHSEYKTLKCIKIKNQLLFYFWILTKKIKIALFVTFWQLLS